jgi:accessory gene regulator protein AgrB
MFHELPTYAETHEILSYHIYWRKRERVEYVLIFFEVTLIFVRNTCIDVYLSTSYADAYGSLEPIFFRSGKYRDKAKIDPVRKQKKWQL